MSEGESNLPSEILLTAALAFAPLAFGTTESWSRAIVFSLVLTTFLLRYQSFGLLGMLPSRVPPAFWGTAALVALAAIQSFNPVSPLTLALARGPFTANRPETFQFIMEWTLYACVLLFLPNHFRSQKAVERLAWVLLTLGAVVAVVGVAQQQAGNTSYYGLRPVSDFRIPFGPFPNKNHAGTYLAICALAGGGLAASWVERYRSLRSGGKSDEFYGRLIVIAALEFLVLVGLLRAHSRGAVVACLCSGGITAAVYVLSGRRVGKPALLAFLLAAAALLSGVARYSGSTFKSYLPAAGENSVSFRYAMVADGVKMVSAFPWTGVGLGALGAAYPLWMDPVMTRYYTDHLHCDPLELAAEAGLPLTAAYYLALLLTLAVSAGIVSRREECSSPLALAFASTAGAVLAHQVLEFPTHIMSVQLTVCVCIAAAWGQGALQRTLPPLSTPPNGSRKLLVGACATAIGLGLLVPSLGAAYFDLLASRYPQPSKQYYKVMASRWEPTLERSLGLALSNWKMALDNPAAGPILLRTALRHSSAALDREPLHPDVRRVQSGLLSSLGRVSDARRFR